MAALVHRVCCLYQLRQVYVQIPTLSAVGGSTCLGDSVHFQSVRLLQRLMYGVAVSNVNRLQVKMNVAA